MKNILLILFILFPTFLFAQEERDELFNEVEIILDKAKSDNANILCAENYASALESYSTAKELLSQGASPIETREYLEASINYLTRMNNSIEGKSEIFASTIAKRNSALDSGADKNAEYFWNLGEDKLQKSLEEYDGGNILEATKYLKTVDEYYSTAKLYSNKSNDLIDNSETIVEANNNLASMLAPTSFENGEEKMFSTLNAISTGKKLSIINKSISDTELLFNVASNNAIKYKDEYPEVVAARTDAKTVEAEKYTLDTWKEGEEFLIESATAFEDKDFDEANKLAMEAKDKYTFAKHTSLKDYFLNDARNEIALAIDEGAEEFAPITLGKSKGYLSVVTALIEGDTYSLPEVKTLTNNSFNSAKNARYITEIAQRMEPGEQSWEEIILTQQGENLIPEEIVVEEEEAPLGNSSAMAKDLEEYLKDDAEVINNEKMVILRLKKVHFTTMKTQLNAEGKASLNRVAEALKQNSNSEATIVSYTDNIGTKSANLALSQKRAETVYNYIKKKNSSTKLFMEGRGEENPFATNSNAEGRKKNRRIEIEIKK